MWLDSNLLQINSKYPHAVGINYFVQPIGDESDHFELQGVRIGDKKKTGEIKERTKPESSPISQPKVDKPQNNNFYVFNDDGSINLHYKGNEYMIMNNRDKTVYEKSGRKVDPNLPGNLEIVKACRVVKYFAEMSEENRKKCTYTVKYKVDDVEYTKKVYIAKSGTDEGATKEGVKSPYKYDRYVLLYADGGGSAYLLYDDNINSTDSKEVRYSKAMHTPSGADNYFGKMEEYAIFDE
jgi:hypothetical protein